ncbi:MAG: DUF1446 domain-containing protein [Alphaproteobacteria bacterium]|nr:DUF1446 domain-containing protein [Alphaproteobacteria bacterium]
MSNIIRIGGASGYWGESMMATPQLLRGGAVDYLVYDFLAEITMSIMARARAAKPDGGYAADFITGVLKPNLQDIATQGVKVLTNAGGVNPQACAAAARAEIKAQGLNLKVATIIGDDLLPRAKELAGNNIKDMFSGTAFPDADELASINAYLGAFPIAAALDRGADIVITGRSVDSAVTLGACIHEFGWQQTDYDKLAAGSLAGHIIECGPQATGGNFTDWHLVADSIATIGYPIVEVEADGTFTCTKPKDTGGIVNVGTISEQMLYEIGDPQAYMLPDVVCDFTQTKITQSGDNKVRVSHAKGAPPPKGYKVCATYFDGFRVGTMMSFVGFDAKAKASAFADAAFTRAQTYLREHNMGDFSETDFEIIGADSQYGDAHAAPSTTAPREVVLKIAAKHAEATGAGVLLKEISGLGLATPAGLTMFAGARAKPSPVARLFSFTIDKARVPLTLDFDGAVQDLPLIEGKVFDAASLVPPPPPQPVASDNMGAVPLVKLAWGRSGDKGNKANIGIIARQAEYVPYIWATLDEAAVAKRFSHFMEAGANITRYYLPGSYAINFLLDSVLGGGGVASLRNDPQGKAYAQILLDHPIRVPHDMADKLERQ